MTIDEYVNAQPVDIRPILVSVRQTITAKAQYDFRMKMLT